MITFIFQPKKLKIIVSCFMCVALCYSSQKSKFSSVSIGLHLETKLFSHGFLEILLAWNLTAINIRVKNINYTN